MPRRIDLSLRRLHRSLRRVTAQPPAASVKDGNAEEHFADADNTVAHTAEGGGDWEALHRQAIQGAATAKVRDGSNAAKWARVKGLSARGENRDAMLAEARAWAAAWRERAAGERSLPSHACAEFPSARGA